MSDRMMVWRRNVAALVLIAMFAGCTTTRTIDVASFADEVVPEDEVSITTTDGRVLSFEVVAVEPDAVIGEGIRVERQEIAALDVTSLSPARTAGLVGATGLTAAALAFLVFAAIAPALILAAAAP